MPRVLIKSKNCHAGQSNILPVMLSVLVANIVTRLDEPCGNDVMLE